MKIIFTQIKDTIMKHKGKKTSLLLKSYGVQILNCGCIWSMGRGSLVRVFQSSSSRNGPEEFAAEGELIMMYPDDSQELRKYFPAFLFLANTISFFQTLNTL